MDPAECAMTRSMLGTSLRIWCREVRPKREPSFRRRRELRGRGLVWGVLLDAWGRCVQNAAAASVVGEEGGCESDFKR